MTRALIIGDVHLSDTPPSLRKSTYSDEILAKLRQAVELAQKLECDFILQNGDMFHIKAPSRTSHALVVRTARVLSHAGMPVLIVPGNHDLQNDRLESLVGQPLGTLSMAPGIELLVGPHQKFPVFGIPYLHDWGLLGGWMSKWRAWSDKQKAENFDFWPLMAAHAPIFPDKEVPPYDYISASDWAELTEVGDVTYGHIHHPHGVYTPIHNTPVTMCNNGAISRGSLHEETLRRLPVVTLWDSTKPVSARFTAYPLDVLPVSEAFFMEEKEDIDAKQVRVEAFLEKVGATSLAKVSIERVLAEARTKDLKPQTLTLLTELLEQTS